MAEPAGKITQRTAERIAAVVKAHEQTGAERKGRRRPARLPLGTILLGKTTTTHQKDSTEPIDVYRGTTKGGETASGETYDAYNRFGDIPSGRWVLMINIGGGFEILQADGC